MEDCARSVRRANTKQQQEPTLAVIAGKASTRQQSVQRQTGRAHLVKQTQTRQQGAMPRLTASVMQALQGRMEDRARRVWREPTKQHQDPPLAVIAGKASIRMM